MTKEETKLPLCRRCLLTEAGEGELYAIIRQRIETLPPEKRADDKLYERRLAVCGECDELIGGVCRKCGCYVELRAARLDGYCPHEKHKWT